MKMGQQVKEPLPVLRACSISLLSGPAEHCSVHSLLVSTKPAVEHQAISLKTSSDQSYQSRELLENKTVFAFWRGLKLFKSNILEV